MPTVRIQSPGDGQGHAQGTRVWLDDVEVRELTNVKAEWPVDGLCTVTLGILAGPTLDLTADARVQVELFCEEGFEVVATERRLTEFVHDSIQTVYSCRRVARPNPAEILARMTGDDRASHLLETARRRLETLEKEKTEWAQSHANSSSRFFRAWESLLNALRLKQPFRRSSRTSDRKDERP